MRPRYSALRTAARGRRRRRDELRRQAFQDRRVRTWLSQYWTGLGVLALIGATVCLMFLPLTMSPPERPRGTPALAVDGASTVEVSLSGGLGESPWRSSTVKSDEPILYAIVHGNTFAAVKCDFPGASRIISSSQTERLCGSSFINSEWSAGQYWVQLPTFWGLSSETASIHYTFSFFGTPDEVSQAHPAPSTVEHSEGLTTLSWQNPSGAPNFRWLRPYEQAKAERAATLLILVVGLLLGLVFTSIPEVVISVHPTAQRSRGVLASIFAGIGLVGGATIGHWVMYVAFCAVVIVLLRSLTKTKDRELLRQECRRGSLHLIRGRPGWFAAGSLSLIFILLIGTAAVEWHRVFFWTAGSPDAPFIVTAPLLLFLALIPSFIRLLLVYAIAHSLSPWISLGWALLLSASLGALRSLGEVAPFTLAPLALPPFPTALQYVSPLAVGVSLLAAAHAYMRRSLLFALIVWGLVSLSSVLVLTALDYLI